MTPVLKHANSSRAPRRKQSTATHTLLFLASLIPVCFNVSAFAQTTGFVYIATNENPGNRVLQYSRNARGSLTLSHQVMTGGNGGSGNGVGNLDPLGSQDSLVLDGTGSILLAVNAGTNSVSSIAVSNTGLTVLSVTASGGTFPNSIALNGNLVYVLNAQGTPNISGFRLSSGVLTPISGSTQTLPGPNTPKPHDIRFSPDGTRLIVADEVNNQLDVFGVSNTGLATAAVTTPSAGSGPFGLRFGRDGAVLNAEANSASVSSYALSADNRLAIISPAVPDGQAASCWITLTGDGKFGFVSNTGNGTISTYHVSANGTLNVENPVTASLGSGAPIDSAITSDSAFLYIIDSALGRVVFFQVHGASLKQIGAIENLPSTIQGIAAQ